MNAEVAIKKTSKCGNSPETLAHWHTEVQVLRLLSHPNCAEMYDCFESRWSLYIVMSFAAGGQVIGRYTNPSKDIIILPYTI
jgi:serine/threonine protein kinase